MDISQMDIITFNQDSFWLLIVAIPILAAIFFLVFDNVTRNCSARHVKARFARHHAQRMRDEKNERIARHHKTLSSQSAEQHNVQHRRAA